MLKLIKFGITTSYGGIEKNIFLEEYMMKYKLLQWTESN